MPEVWFITGCSRGLGFEIAQAALESGASLVATARNPEQLGPLVEKHGSDRVLPLALDVARNDEVLKAVKQGHEKFGRIDIVVNNAGYSNVAAIEDIDIDDFRAQIDTNFFGVVYVSKAVLPIMRQQGSGHIFQVSSIGGRLGTPGLSAYQSGKWAIGGFSTVLSKEVAPFGIKVTVLEPGAIATDFASKSMSIAPVSEPYEQTVGMMAKMIKNVTWKQSSPAKIGEIVVKLSREEKPPLRILIGFDAVKGAEQAADALAASDKQWHELSLSSYDS